MQNPNMRAHLLVENRRGEILVDEDVFDIQVANMVSWVTGDRRGAPDSHEHEVSLSDLERIEITPVQDPTKVRGSVRGSHAARLES